MLSLLPAMLRIPMKELAPALPLRAEIQEALNGAPNPERILLDWIELYERGEWAACDAMAEEYGLSPEELARCYTEAVLWAETAADSAA